MTDTLFSLLANHDLIDWPAVNYALVDSSKLPNPLSREALTSFAEKCLASLDVGSPGFEEISSLVLDCPHSREEMLRHVSAICSQVGVGDEKTVARKWRAVELEWILQNLDADPVYALVQISSFWAKWGWPSDAPASIAADSVSGADYGSAKHMQSVLTEHQAWLQEELYQLR